MKHKDFWTNAVANLKLVLPEHAINAWFEPLNAIAISEGNILLEVPNQFFCEWIDSHYKDELTASIQKVDKAISGYRFNRNKTFKGIRRKRPCSTRAKKKAYASKQSK